MANTKRHLQENEWVTIRESTVDDDGFRQPGFKAKLVEDVSKETIKGDVVLMERFFPGDQYDSRFYVPKGVVTEIAEQLPEPEYRNENVELSSTPG